MSSGPPPTRRSYSPYECVSQIQKAIRRGQEETAIFFALELDDSGYSGWAFARLKIIASEDVGIADPLAVLIVRAMYENWVDARKKDKKAKGGLHLTHAVLALARAPKSRIADSAYMALGEHAPRREVEDVALDIHTREGQRRGRGWEHFFTESGLLADPETGELTEDGSTPDPYRERARAILESGAADTPASPATRAGATADRVRQLQLEQDGEER
jgi:MgsA AAA+ ATPase C terminal